MRDAEHERWLTAIRKDPGDRTAKLVYADWLDERGDHDAARLARDLCRVHAGEDVEPWAAPVESLRLIARGFAPPNRTRVDALSPFESALIPWFRASWLAVGLATGPCDRSAVEAAADLAYAQAGLPAPKLRIWLSGPLHGAVGAAMLNQVWAQVGDQVGDQVRAQVGAQVGDQVRDQVRAQVWDQVWAQVRDQVRAQVGDQVGAQVRAQVWAQVGDQVGDQVRAQVWDQVRAQVWDQVRAQVRDQVWDQVGDQVWAQVRDQVRDQVYRAGYGQQDASWLAFYAYFSSTGLAAADKLAGLFAQHACGWWWPFEGAVILTERPTLLEMSRGKLVLVEYADGTRVDRRPVDPKRAARPRKIKK